jgi:hypothetical protein
MTKIWETKIDEFLILANKHQVRMLMIGGGAVNFHGYQRHSADIDFWIDTTQENFKKLINVFQEMEYDIIDFPAAVKNKQQNISIKFNKSFDDAYSESSKHQVKEVQYLRWNVLSLEDLITSKIKANRPKDLLDIIQLKEINKESLDQNLTRNS